MKKLKARQNVRCFLRIEIFCCMNMENSTPFSTQNMYSRKSLSDLLGVLEFNENCSAKNNVCV